MKKVFELDDADMIKAQGNVEAYKSAVQTHNAHAGYILILKGHDENELSVIMDEISGLFHAN